MFSVYSQEFRDEKTDCQDLISSMSNNPVFLHNIITDNETWCSLYNAQTNLKPIGQKSPPSTWKMKRHEKQSTARMTLETFADSRGTIQNELIPEAVTINKE